MPKCPKCREKIGYLNAEYRSTFIEHYALQGDQAIFEDAGDEPGEYELEGFKCPECGEMLFDSESEAEAFLKGEMEVENDA